MRRRKLIRYVLLAVGAAVLGFVALTKWRASQPVDAPYPEIELSTDPEVLARGEYLVFDVAGCDRCHARREDARGRSPQARPDLAGGSSTTAPAFGTLYYPNITPDPEHGIGRYQPREVARMLRTGVGPDGSRGLTMAGILGDMSDDDLAAVVSYLYSRPAVPNAVQDSEFSLLYEAMVVWMFDPEGLRIRAADPAPPIGPTVERGAYLARGPAACFSCHSPRSATFALDEATLFSGCSMTQDVYEDPGMVTCAPNLTPDPSTGYMSGWHEDQFVARMRTGRVYAYSNMPWEAFAGMHEDDLRALFRFFRSLPPVEHETGPTYRPADAE